MERRRDGVDVLEAACARGELQRRPIHGDPKINNVMLDELSGRAVGLIDLDTVKTGERRAGAYFSIWSMTRKASYALGITIGTGAAVLFGFDSLADPVNNPNSSESLLWLACLYSVIPAMFKFVAMPLLWNYPLTEARLAEVQKEIQAESGSAPSPTKS